jgi:hypothetical protein
MRKEEALARVASHIAGLMSASDFEENTGVFSGEVSDADAERLDWAIEEVKRRLWRMGRQSDD